MATNKASRAQPPKNLENYVASIQYLFDDPNTISDLKFIQQGTFLNETDLTDYSVDVDNHLDTQPIGFDITINGKTYKHFSIATAGWLLLLDPTANGVDYEAIITEFERAENTSIKSTQWGFDHILLAPWFDLNIPVSGKDFAKLREYYYSNQTDDTEDDVNSGKNTQNWPFNKIDNGVRYINYHDVNKGKCLLARWTVSQVNYGNRLKFEVALYENGRIEYRYWPILTYEEGTSLPNVTSAAIGVFWAHNKFRDFAPILGYDLSTRTLSPLGGAPYDTNYTNTGKKYTNTTPINHWPRNGAIITYSPPVNAAKFLPRKLSALHASVKNIIRPPGLFNDRKTVNFNISSENKPCIVDMPSTLSDRFIGDIVDVDISLRQLLFTSGSIQVVSGAMKKSVIDSQLEQLNILSSLNNSSDKSFNESQKNYLTTESTSSFYMTGSSLELFGPGFTSPLKSKTQFTLSLPVEKQATMPSLTSSFYYYDATRKSWLLIAQDQYRNIERTFAERDRDEPWGDVSFTYNVTETARGFDAVGRKIVSGSNVIDFASYTGGARPPTYQTSNAIGSHFQNNLNIDQNGLSDRWLFENSTFEEASTAITLDYSKSITNSKDFRPKASQKIKLDIEYPFLIEKVVVDLPLYINGNWFNDVTTCNRAFAISGSSGGGQNVGRPHGPVDFSGPGLTFGLFCHRGNGNISYLDLIASGTITHMNDNMSDVILKKDPGMQFYSLRPTGFKSFSNPSCVISGSGNIFEGIAKMELEASIAGGLTFARNDRSFTTGSSLNSAGTTGDYLLAYEQSNMNKACFLLSSPKLITKGELSLNNYDGYITEDAVTAEVAAILKYRLRSPRIYVQQVSPLARGSANIEFSGNSILGGNIASFNLESSVSNPLYCGFTSGSIPTKYTEKINAAKFGFDATSIYSTVDSRPSPYLMLPGDQLTISMSKTRPVVYQAICTGTGPIGVNSATGDFRFEKYNLSGSHGTVMLNTGSINITIYGSYVREGMEYNP